eukprot:2963969-Pyramimonas_sp.AAC.1
MPSASTLVNTTGMCLFSSSSIIWRTPLRMPFRDSIEVARWPGTRIRSSVPLAIMVLAASLFRAPSPSEYNNLKGP